MNLKLTHYENTKLLQLLAWAGAIYALFFAWSMPLVLSSLLVGWLYSGFGLGICHHRYAAHMTFQPKHRLIKWGLLFIGTIITHGSVIAWTITHRYHHKYCDTHRDPTNPSGSAWHKIKCFFYHFDNLECDHKEILVIDLMRDRDFVFFHNHHFSIIAAYIGSLALINPVLVLYFYCIPVCYVLFTSGWVTTLAHTPALSVFGYRNYATDDKTLNSQFWQIFTMGDGYHNNHHACPWLYNMAVTKDEFDLCGQIVKLIGHPNDLPPSPVNKREYV